MGKKEGRKVCMDCRWAKYIRGGIWICAKENAGKVFGVVEVHPLQLGCDEWEFKEKGNK
jgi:hypothetical protein